MNIYFYILIIALILDAVGEYPNAIHPVVWVGKIIDFFDRRRKRGSHAKEFTQGFLLFIFVSIIFILPMLLIMKILEEQTIFYIIFQAFFLKASFSLGALVRHVKRCSTDDYSTLKKNVSMIVSRNVEDLDKGHLYSAAIESGAENIVDSVVSPLFYFILFGVPGAFMYRIINTFDAMIGYRNERYEYFGKFVARLDDIVNFIPARITGFLFLIIKPKNVIDRLKKYRKLKINGMYTIASMAGILDVTLEKINYYRIEGKRMPERKDVDRSILYIMVISMIWIIITAVVIYYGLPWWSKGI